MIQSDMSHFQGTQVYEKIKIVLADDHPLIRQAIRALLEKQHDMEIVAEVANGKEAIDVTTKLKPDVLILDISMPKLNGLEVTKQIATKFPRTAVLVLTVHTDNQHISSLIEAGARGYLTKEVPSDDIVHTVRAIASGENVFPSGSKPQICEGLSNTSLPPNHFSDLTEKELTILKLIAKGMSNKEIGTRVNLSTHSIKASLTTIFLKIGVSSRTEAVFNGLKTGIINLEELKKS